jgi:adenylate kinase
VNLLLLGPQGSGKGTQAKRIAEAWEIPHVSTGDMFRALDDSTELGREVKAIMERGELVPDETTIRMIEDRLSQHDAVDGFVLDGFPRNLAQARALDAMLAGIGRSLDAILFFDLPDDVALERMKGRAGEEGRGDDTPEAMRRRLQIYHDQTVPVVEHYRASGKLVPLHATRSVDEVFAEIESALDTVGTR